MIIGNFSYDKSGDTYAGTIRTLAVAHYHVLLNPIRKTGENGPEYRVLYRAEGGDIEIGAAWRRSSEKGRGFVSVTLDDPTLPAPISAAMFLATDEATATLLWTRQTSRAKDAASIPGTPKSRRGQAGVDAEAPQR